MCQWGVAWGLFLLEERDQSMQEGTGADISVQPQVHAQSQQFPDFAEKGAGGVLWR